MENPSGPENIYFHPSLNFLFQQFMKFIIKNTYTYIFLTIHPDEIHTHTKLEIQSDSSFLQLTWEAEVVQYFYILSMPLTLMIRGGPYGFHQVAVTYKQAFSVVASALSRKCRSIRNHLPLTFTEAIIMIYFSCSAFSTGIHGTDAMYECFF